MQALLRALFGIIALVLIASLAAAGSPQAGGAERLSRVAAGLAGIGYEVELESLSVETGTARRNSEDLRALRELYLPPAHDDGWPDLLGAFGDWRADAPEKLREKAVKELGRKLIAFYQPDRRALVFFTTKDTHLGKLNRTDFVVAHELVRAWRDARSGLRESFAGAARTREASWTLRCVLEGEARLAAIAADLRAMGGGLDGFALEQLDDPMVQAYPEEHLSLACTYGTRLALQRWREGGWSAVRGMWDEPPTSTEQILHLEKLGVDQPTAVVAPRWPAGELEGELLSEIASGSWGSWRSSTRCESIPTTRG